MLFAYYVFPLSSYKIILLRSCSSKKCKSRVEMKALISAQLFPFNFAPEYVLLKNSGCPICPPLPFLHTALFFVEGNPILSNRGEKSAADQVSVVLHLFDLLQRITGSSSHALLRIGI